MIQEIQRRDEEGSEKAFVEGCNDSPGSFGVAVLESTGGAGF